MKKNLFIAAMGLVVLAGCSNNEEIDNVVAKADNAITFDSYVGKTTKATDKSSFISGDKFAVLGYYQKEGTYSNFIDNFMPKEVMTSDGSNWGYTNTKYWPNSPDKLSFVAFYPNDLTPSINNTDSKGDISIPFTVNSLATAQVDMMWSTIKDASIDKKGGEAVNGKTDNLPTSTQFKFQHALSKVLFKAKFDGDKTGITVTLTDISINNINSVGTYTILNTLAAGNWSGDATPVTYTILDNGAASVDVTAGSALGESLLMIPQNVAEKEITIGYNLTYDTGIKIPYTATLKLANDAAWVQNTIYTYTLKISLDKITMSATFEPWNSTEGGGNI